ncbi:hypothetical protein BST81_15055 [Leptolyngbya sp. 'hensonii']|uniref:DUF790 family protein n=1 Tax=Leptolyngbya sp. 'hensonii' TaxID=1922337 RepID=UPI0009502CC5|nr:DUF790 family protein [Leptolyngbya sp. 'hensonii']OLP17640.1 hypothetical protein BST81_15055 [Leptolyngbya sp. 'hensonii']
MLPSELLIHRQNGEAVIPKHLELNEANRAIATELIRLFQAVRGQTLGELDRHLQELEGDTPDYRIRRGLAHLLKSEAFSKFEIISPLEPQSLREQVFSLAARTLPSPLQTEQTLSQLAATLSQNLEREVVPQQIQAGLYADLMENRILTEFEAPTPESLLHRYNLSQVQGVFYRASEVKITAHRNDPGQYKLLFRYLKLFRLMAYIEGDADHGFTITIDGPTSLFSETRRYGLSFAKLLPALLHVTQWSLKATLHWQDEFAKTKKTGQFSLDADCELVSHYKPDRAYDSMIEQAFADRWSSLKTDWLLEREVDLIPIPGSVMIPDFRLVHPDGRSWLLEIVGYWRPEYLRKKFSQVRQSGRSDLILAISERLNLEKAGVKLGDVPTPILWFKDRLIPKDVLAILDKAV